MQHGNNSHRAPWSAKTRVSAVAEHGPNDWVTSAEFRRDLADRFAPSETRATMDKLKKVVDKAIADGKVTASISGRFRFGDLTAAVARSRSGLSDQAKHLPHTQIVVSTAIPPATSPQQHRLDTVPDSFAEAVQQNITLRGELAHCRAQLQAVEAELQHVRHMTKTRQERGRQFGLKGAARHRASVDLVEVQESLDSWKHRLNL
jgi:hypothetical protein